MVMSMCSGVIMGHGSTPATTAIPELTAYSGSAYLYFYSDAAVNMSGFSIRYRYVCYADDIDDSYLLITPLRQYRGIQKKKTNI